VQISEAYSHGAVSHACAKIVLNVQLHAEIQTAIASENEAGKFSFKEMFGGGRLQNGRRMLLCLLAGLGCQMSGINLITQYAPIIFQSSIGMIRSTSQLVAGLNSLEYMLATIPPIFYIEKVGRRKILMVGALGQCLTMAILAITVHNGNYAAGIVGAAMLFLTRGSLTLTFLPESRAMTSFASLVNPLSSSHRGDSGKMAMRKSITMLNAAWKATGNRHCAGPSTKENPYPIQ
jgi:hypothetical protein